MTDRSYDFTGTVRMLFGDRRQAVIELDDEIAGKRTALVGDKTIGRDDLLTSHGTIEPRIRVRGIGAAGDKNLIAKQVERA